MSDVVEQYKRLLQTGYNYANGDLNGAPTSTFLSYMGHFSDIGHDIESEILRLRSALSTAREEGRKAGLEEAAKALEAENSNGLERQICCDGQMCGCLGSTVGEYAAHVVRALKAREAGDAGRRALDEVQG